MFLKEIRNLVIPVLAVGCLHGDSIRDTQDALVSWVETRKTIAETEAEWSAEKEIVNDLLQLLERESEKLETAIAQLEETSDAADSRRLELNAKREKLLSISNELKEVLPALEARVRDLLGKLPDPLLAELSELIQRLPDAESEGRMPISQRLLTVVGILNKIDKFNTEITLTSEIRGIDGMNVEVKTLYFGLAGAYFASSDGKHAGVGIAGDDGWRWSGEADIAGQVVRLIETYEGNRQAAFTRLPVTTN